MPEHSTELAADFALTAVEVEAALRYEFELRVKRLKRPRAQTP